MLKIEWDDVIGVLQSCTTQIAVILGALILMIIALVACRKMKKSKKFMIRSQAVIAAVLAVLITANSVCFGPLSTLISLAAGNGTVSEETAEEAKEVAQRVAEEGFVLLKNDNGALPLQTSTKLNLFGWAASSPVTAVLVLAVSTTCMKLSVCKKAWKMQVLRSIRNFSIFTVPIPLTVLKCPFRNRAGLFPSLPLVPTLRS